jgi:hypothetical protein
LGYGRVLRYTRNGDHESEKCTRDRVKVFVETAIFVNLVLNELKRFVVSVKLLE